MTLATLAALFGVAFAAFTIEATIGFGATVLAAALGAQLVPLSVMLPAFVPVNMLLSLWLLVRGRRLVEWRVLWREAAPPLVIGAGLGLALAHVPAQLMLQLVFAVLVVAMAAIELGRLIDDTAPVDETRPLRRPVRIAVLLVGGTAHGLFGTGGPMIVYVLRRRITDKTAFRATLAVIWLTLNVALLINFASLGRYDGALGAGWREGPLVISAALGAAILPATAAGSWLHKRLDQRTFQRAVCVLLLIAGALLAIRTGLQLTAR